MTSMTSLAAGILAELVSAQRAEESAAAHRMAASVAWADLHQVDAEGLGAVDPDIATALLSEDLAGARCGVPARAMSGPGGMEGELRLAGEGCFAISEFAVAELAAALGLSEPSARSYLGQSLELRDRLPRCWAAVHALTLPAWKARQIAASTIPLAAKTAACVDAQLAPFAHKISLGRILACVDAAVMRFEPDLAAARSAQAAEKRGAWVEDRIDGTSSINLVTDTPDAVAFDHALDDVATTLGALGDTEPRQVRRAKAVGVLADPQYALDLTAAADGPSTAEEPDSETPASGSISRNGGAPTLHVHLHAAAVAGLGVGGGGGLGPVARVEGLDGRHPVSRDSVLRWLVGLTPGARIKLTRVVDLTEHISVDAYEVPTRLADQVAERDTCCVFPWCGSRARYDLDHRVPFVVDDPSTRGTGPPPGQTATDRLHRLCRFHHRVKTHSAWAYARAPDGSLTWSSPIGAGYRVDHTGTTPLA